EGIIDAPAGTPDTWVPTVTFNGRAATGVRIANNNTVYVTVPRDATTGVIQVGGKSGPVIKIDRTPVLNSVAPMMGATGTPITLQVRAPADVRSISFGGTVVSTGFTISRASDG